MLHRLQDRLLGNRIESDALDGDALEHLLVLQHLQDVPRDCLALAIRVGGEDQLVRALNGRGNFLHHLGATAFEVPVHGEIVIGLHRPVFRGQIAHVTDRSNDVEVLAKVFVDRFGLRGRFDNDDVHAHR